jgi:hypothetical protein
MELTVQEASIVMNALKNGVVPDEDLAKYCIGREREVMELHRCICKAKEGNGVVKFLAGDYGSGKTFLLQLFKQQAMKEGFVIADLTMHSGLRLNNIESIYYHIMHNLHITESTLNKRTSFEDLFNQWIEKLQKEDPLAQSKEMNKVIASISSYNHSFARALLQYIRARIRKDVELSNAIASWITGEKNIPYALKSQFDVIGAIDKTNCLSFLKGFIELVTAIKFTGVIILIDEVELLMEERSDFRQHAYENIRLFIDLCGGGKLKNTGFIFAGTEKFFSDHEKGIRAYEALSQRLGKQEDSQITDIKQPILKLSQLSDEHFQGLTDFILRMYKVLYNFTPNIQTDSIKNWVFLLYRKSGKNPNQLTVREFLTKLLEILDLMEQHKERHMFKTELKMVKHNEQHLFVNNNMQKVEQR